jgi:hypothetical protein
MICDEPPRIGAGVFPLRAMFLRITARALQPAPFKRFEAFKAS